MTYFTFNQDQRARLRSAITAHPSWPSYARTNGLSASTMKIDDMTKAAEALGISLHLYGTAKGAPVPKPFAPEVLHVLSNEALELFDFMSSEETERFANISTTAREKQEGRLSEKQYSALKGIISKAETRKLLGQKPEETPAPAPKAETPKTLGLEDLYEETEEEGEEDEDPDMKALKELFEKVKTKKAKPAGISEERVLELIKTHGGTPAHVTLDLRTPEGVKPSGEALMHYRFPLLLSAVQAGVNVMLVGPAGSGKTTACEKAAELMGRPFYFTGAIDSPYKLLGFKTAQGETVRTPFREAFEHGGFFLFDEMDSSLPAAVTPFNSATANRVQDFPDSIVKAHPDFVAVAACNTFGRGASREYVGRFQQDAAVLDRYVMLSWDYDTALEAAMLGLPRPEGAPVPASINRLETAEAVQAIAERWLAKVQATRAKIEANKVRHVVSPRAALQGTKLLAAGWPWHEVEEACLFKGLDMDSRLKIA